MFAPRALWPAFVWAAVILFLCLLPGSKLPEWDWFALLDLDKLVHAGLFFIQALLLARAFHARGTPVHWLLWSLVITVLYGLATEFMQGLEAMGRRTEINDMIANSVGALAAGVYTFRRTRKGKPVLPFAFLR
jgi:VanZ family protein